MATTSARKTVDVQVISKRELADYRADVKGEIFRLIRRRFNFLKENFDFTQDHLARRLGLDKGLLSRRLRGKNDLQLESLSDLARGLDCRIDVKLTPLTEIVTIADMKGLPFCSPNNPVVARVESRDDWPSHHGVPSQVRGESSANVPV